MPRIDPNQLLKCLGALLSPVGGIRSTEEVKRIAALMSKFSKKLVSKCIYIQILKNTQSDLLVEFMAEGGWALVFQWLDDAIVNNNYPLIREILELLLVCPISLDRLKENNCPKVVKGLSKDSEDEQVKTLASKLVEQWLKFIKSGQAAISDVAMAAAATAVPKATVIVTPSEKSALTASASRPVPVNEVVKKVTASRKIPKSAEIVADDSSTDEDDRSPEEKPIGSLPLYKITVRDGKSVLAKIGTKTLSIPASKKPESSTESGAVASVVLKSDPVTKRFRYVSKSLPEKSDASENLSDDSSSREKSSESKISEKRESASGESESSESSKFKATDSKSKSEKSNKEKSKDKSHRDKSDSKHKDRRKSDHKSHRSDKDRDKSKHKESSKDRHRDDKIKSRDKDLKKESKSSDKLLSAAEKAQIQADRDKDTLEKIKTPAISLLGKIPKKSSTSVSSASKSSNEFRKSESPLSDKTEAKKPETKKPADIRSPKDRPKTVKTYNSKFRSTGLEEEIKPPPPRGVVKKKMEEKKQKAEVRHPALSSPTQQKDGSPPEKKSKMAEIITEVKKDRIADKPGGVKLIPPKPKPALQESDMFSDALTASIKQEPRKRKRRTSGSKDGPEVKKEVKEETSSSTSEPISPKEVKPKFKFYRDTLEDNEEEKNKENVTEVKTEAKNESDSEDSSKQTSTGESEESIAPKLYPNGVLVNKLRKGPKKSVKWKEESDLISIKYFELDETERVNVTRNFVDMKIMERSHEREAFLLARKLATDDTMEETIPYGPLYEVDIPPDRRPAVEPGKSSQEKNVQYAREKTVLQAIYFHRSAIPDSPAEPDFESHPTTDPKMIPLDDITGNTDSVNDFTHSPWPEPKPALTPSSPPPPLQPAVGFGQGYSTVGNFSGFPQMGMPPGVVPPGQSNWRPPSGDGKDVALFQPPNGPMVPPTNVFGAEGGFNVNGPPPGFNPAFQMACDPSMFAPPMPAMPPQWARGGWQGPRGPPMMPPKYPKGVCHNFVKFGNCSRGNSCRFMHPGFNCPPLP